MRSALSTRACFSIARSRAMMVGARLFLAPRPPGRKLILLPDAVLSLSLDSWLRLGDMGPCDSVSRLLCDGVRCTGVEVAKSGEWNAELSEALGLGEFVAEAKAGLGEPGCEAIVSNGLKCEPLLLTYSANEGHSSSIDRPDRRTS